RRQAIRRTTKSDTANVATTGKTYLSTSLSLFFYIHFLPKIQLFTFKTILEIISASFYHLCRLVLPTSPCSDSSLAAISVSLRNRSSNNGYFLCFALQ
ncbi:unnamed protein product, partial [Brassica oleracea var. botrytis]